MKAARAAIQDAVQRGDLKPLPEDTVLESFLALAAAIGQRTLGREPPLVVAISGNPGTGKSTLSAYLKVLLQEGFGLQSACFSMDDLYLDHEQRLDLGARVHPLFAHRGVPGTHHLDLGFSVIESLRKAGRYSVTKLPRFSKNTDNPWPQDKWPAFVGRPDVILIDSWFWNTQVSTDEQLRVPINQREANEDEDGVWRRAVNDFLREGYPAFFDQADFWIHLEGPSWDATVRWRVDQEMDLRAEVPEKQRPAEDPTERLRYFLETFQRWGIQAHSKEPDVNVRLAEDHSIAIDG